ncbi:B-cell receptor CD22-like [Alosa pseudoharengus]|uniref:B-cell receptor CD22-like n=1 Tax=Alosa pseudoharengus TaxID=34774 RepID=UPI003F8B52CE
MHPEYSMLHHINNGAKTPLYSMCLVFCVVMIQGVSCQKWGVNLTHDHICAVSGSSVAMPCSFTHPPGLTVTKVFWTINPQPNIEPTDLLDMPTYKDRVLYSADISKNCTLTLREVTVADAGEYNLRIVTGHDKEKWLQRHGLHLTVTELSVWIPKPVTEGSDVTMSCNHSCGLEDNPRVIWRKNGEELPFKQGNNIDLIRVNVSTGEEGGYACALKGFEEHSSTSVKLDVMCKYTSNQHQSKIPSVLSSESYGVFVGGSVTLTCSSDANPPVENYTWFKVDESTPVGSGQQYSITNISSEDGGQYYCEARNKYGAENSTVVSITVTDLVLPEEQNTFVAFVIVGVIVAAIVGFSCALFHMIRGQTKEEISVESRAAGSPSVVAARGTEGDGHYSTVQPHGSTQTAGGAEDHMQYSTIQPHGQTEDTQPKEEEEEVQYVTVHILRPKKSNSPVQPEVELTTIYSTVTAIRKPKQNKQQKAISKKPIATQ